MKKLKPAVLLLTLLLIFSLIPPANIYAESSSTVIDGICYTIHEYSDTVLATLAADVTPMKEIHVQSNVTINGISYPVESFDFSVGFHRYGDWISQIDYKNSRYAVKTGSWADVLEKAKIHFGRENVKVTQDKSEIA